MKFSELSNQGGALQIPQLDRSEIRLLWVTDFYDTVISGLLSYRGRKYYFHMHEAEQWMGNEELPEGENWHPPTYVVIELTNEQLMEEEKWHQLFVEKVWNGWDYAEDQKIIWAHHKEAVVGSGSEESHKEYYRAFNNEHTPLDLTDNLVIGWFIH